MRLLPPTHGRVRDRTRVCCSMIYEVLIIGAGVEGSATGYNLVKNGTENVLVLEQFDALHTRGSSHGGSRMVANTYRELFYVQMMNECYEMWRDIEQESGRKLYFENGCLAFGESPAVQSFSEQMIANGAVHQVLSAKEVNKKYSRQLKLPDHYKCFFVDNCGMVRASHALATLQDLYVKNGGKLLDQHRVTGLRPGPIVGVETDKGTFRAKRVIVTAGSWTKDIIQSTGVSLPLKIWRTEALYWSADNPDFFTADVFPTFLYINDDEYFEFYGLPIKEYHGLLRIAYHSGPEISNPEMRDADPRSHTSKNVSDFIQKHFIGIKENPAVMETCMYTVTPDVHPFIDRHPLHSNIIIGAGFSGKGFKFAPLIGKLLSELALGLPPSLDLNPFLISRFDPPKSSL